MAVSSIANLFSFFTPSKPPPTPKIPFLQFSVSSSSKPNQDGFSPLQVSSSDSDVTSVVYPSLANANTLFFRSAYNVQVIVDDNEHEERLIGRFRREVMRAGVIQECKRRRYFENSQDEKKRRTRDAAKRNRKRRGPPPSRSFGQDKQETTKSKRDDDDEDNWELPDGGIPN
ncbi:small ribosomal subunit protein bS21c isoform X3 [Lycium ferocissimum]|uniref:small ribosomal subunit protein bS21c isoform X3 n=1 Tax=Lycium ferocissimum TaxID=112874 RepID=UPI00281522C4|nr:small ribosomal subunit protein bS21c isoform X3 [Lycium ferocissimum]